MICIPTEIPRALCAINDELKAIYHSNNSVCIWVFKSTDDRDRFVKETAGMKKDERTAHYNALYA